MKYATKLLAGFLVIALMAALFAACGAATPEGKWVFGANSYVFNEDKTFKATMNGMTSEGTYEVEDNTIVLSYKGLLGDTSTTLTYEIKGDSLTLNGDVSLLGGQNLSLTYTKAD